MVLNNVKLYLQRITVLGVEKLSGVQLNSSLTPLQLMRYNTPRSDLSLLVFRPIIALKRGSNSPKTEN